MDKISKALEKLSSTERAKIKKILQKIIENKLTNLDIKKLKGFGNIFRARSGTIRIIFKQNKNESIKLISIARKNEKTYKL